MLHRSHVSTLTHTHTHIHTNKHTHNTQIRNHYTQRLYCRFLAKSYIMEDIVSMQELASLMRKGRTFLIPDANSCIDCEPHKGCPRFAMNASIHLTHSFAFSAFSMEVSSTTVGFENCKNLKLIFEGKNA